MLLRGWGQRSISESPPRPPMSRPESSLPSPISRPTASYTKGQVPQQQTPRVGNGHRPCPVLLLFKCLPRLCPTSFHLVSRR